MVSVVSASLLTAAAFFIYHLQLGTDGSVRSSSVETQDLTSDKGLAPESCIGCTEPTAAWTPQAPLTSSKSLVFRVELYGSGPGGEVTGLELSDLSITGSATGCVLALDLQPDAYFTARSIFVSCQSSGTVQVNLAANSLADRNGNLGPISQSSSEPVEIVNGAVLTVQRITYAMGEGGAIVAQSLGIDCRNVCTYVLPAGQSVTLTAVPDAKNVFLGWRGVCSGSSACSFTLNGDMRIEADFLIGQPLSVTKIGSGSGSVTSTPAVLNCGTTCAVYNLGNVTLTAKASRGSIFVGWFGTGCAGTGTCVINSGGSVFAVFNLK